MAANLLTLTREKREFPMKRLLMPATTLTTLRKIAFTLLCCTVLMVFAAPAQTLQSIKADPGTNEGPPAGAILDLSGTPVPGGGNGTYQQYTVNFVAGVANTAITFAFREDPAFISLANVSVVDTTTESGNLLFNGDFSQGTYTNNGNGLTPNGWTYANIYGAYAGGIVESGSGFCYTINDVPVNYCWYDGAVQAYDAISQTITTTIGDNYQITFWVADNSGCYVDGGPPCNFSDISTNGDTTDTGGNGINVTVYAQAGLPPPPPPGETLTLTELGLGAGTVTDNTEQINCSEANGVVTGTCSASYASGTTVTLTATLNSESTTFGGWGGACASFTTSTTCNLTMTSAQSVSASFNAPGPTQAGTVSTTAPTLFNYEGGFSPTTEGYDYNAELTSGSPVTVQVTAIPNSDCNTIVDASFPGAYCFVYDNANGPSTYAPVLFEVTCPPGETCGSNANPFNAILGSDFWFEYTNNPNLPMPTSPPYLPLFGFLKGSGPDPMHPCTLNPGNSPALFSSNQILSFVLPPGEPPASGKSSSGGTGSCWVLTYNTPGEAPSVNIVAPANGGTYQLGQATSANYTCTTVNNTNVNGGVAGPYLTTASCTATDTPGGSVAQGAQFDTATLGPHTFTATVVDSATNTVSQTVTYNVVGATDVAILNVAPPMAATGSKLTNVIGVGDLGPVNAVNVVVSDTLAHGTTFLSASGSNIACPVVNKKVTCSKIPVPCAFANGAVSCNVGTIMPLSLSDLNGAVIEVTVQVTATGTTKNPTILSNTATVSASNADTNPSNNSSTATTKVY